MIKKYCLNMDIELHKRIKIQCIKEEITFTDLIIMLAEEYMNDLEPEEKE